MDEEIEEPIVHDVKIYAVKTIIGRENVVLETMTGKAKVGNLFIKSMHCFQGLSRVESKLLAIESHVSSDFLS